MKHRRRHHRRRAPRVGFRVISGDEAQRQIIETDRYLDGVRAEVAASKLPQARKDSYATWYAGFRQYVQDVVNMNVLERNLSSASISDRAEAYRDAGKAWSAEARAAGAPAIAPPAPYLPGEGGDKALDRVLGVVKWGVIAYVAVNLVHAVTAER